MSVNTVYLETSVLGSLAPRQPADRKRIVKALLAMLDGKRGVPAISAVVVEEFEAAPPAVADSVRQALAMIQPQFREITEAVRHLARAYLEAGILPERRLADALHVAAATCHGDDYLVSWNHRHLTRPLKRLQYEAVNRLHGYLKSPLICNPLEVLDELRD
jgi:hypothetical protein